ncbi:MAG: N-acetyltransferase [Firmicutes bacterium]|nr:N-acetyltransferase [Bacillota bacterium]
MNMSIRSEHIGDYNQVAEVIFDAFARENYTCEAILVDVHRRGRNFDPNLSLVAELDGRIVGHCLFYPHQIVVGGEQLTGVALAPIAVAPKFQGRGIGGMLIEEGHRRAREKGHKFAFLLGHPEYYPRFGYKPGMFGECAIEVDCSQYELDPDLKDNLVFLGASDILTSLWQYSHAGADLAIVPGNQLQEWKPNAAGVDARVFGGDNKCAGYLRFVKKTGEIKEFAARGKFASEHMLAWWANQYGTTCRVPVHPDSRCGREMLSGKPVLHRWGAAMIKILDNSCQEIVHYCQCMDAGNGKPGLMNWPAFYDVTEEA